jgi:hypothetical protein
LPADVRERVPLTARRVRTLRVDDYVEEHNLRVDLVKIDAESAEMHVLEGMRHVLDRQRPVISLEVGDLDVPDVPSSRELLDHLVAADYRPYEPRDGRLTPHTPKSQYDYQNLIFLAKGSPDDKDLT